MSEYKIIVAFNFINKVIENLKEKNLISKEPLFDIGVTKLAYRFFKKSIKKAIEDLEDENTNTAESKKITQGIKSLDVDLYLDDKLDPKDAFNKIKEEIAKSGEIVTSTISDIFVTINGIKINFLLIVDEETKKYLKYWKSLSIDDEVNDINSVFLIDVHNALCRLISTETFIKEVADITSMDYDKLMNQVQITFRKNYSDIANNTSIRKGMHVTLKGKEYICLSKKGNEVNLKSKDSGEQVTSSSLDVTPVFSKYKKIVLSPSINGLMLKGIVKIKGQETSKSFDLLESPINKLSLLYPENIAKILLGKTATEDDLYSLTKTLKYINSNFDDDKKKKIWDYLINSKRTLSKLGSQFSEEEYRDALKKIGEKIGINKIIDQDFPVIPIDKEISNLTEQANSLIYNEEKKTKRIPKLDGDPTELSTSDYVDLLEIIYPHITKGNLVADNTEVNIVEKIDALYCQFGLNKNKDFFMESRDSGEVTKDNYETKFSDNETFKNTFKFLLENKLVISVLNSLSKELDDPIKFEAELIVNPNADDIEAPIKVKEVSYDRKIVGNQGSFMVFNAQVLDGKNWTQPNRTALNKLITNVQDADSKEWRVFSDTTHASIAEPLPIDFNFKQLDTYLKSENGITKLKELLNSKLTPEKRRVVELLTESKKKIQEALDTHSNNVKSNFSPDAIEGLIIRAKAKEGKVIEFKAYSENYVNEKETNSKLKNETEDIISNLKAQIKSKLLHLNVNSDTSVTQSLYQVSSKDPSVQDPSQIITETLKNLVKETADFTNVKKEAIELLRGSKNKLIELKDAILLTKETSDPIKYKNNIQLLKDTNNELKRYSKILKGNSEGIEFLIEVFKSIYKVPLKKILGESFNYLNEEVSETENSEFENWFRGSKLVDDLGKPRVFYHGTNEKFNKFEIGKKSIRSVLFDEYEVTSSGIFFSESAKDARGYGKYVNSFYLRSFKPFLSPDMIPASTLDSTECVKVYNDCLYIFEPAIVEKNGKKYIEVENGINYKEVINDEKSEDCGEWLMAIFSENLIDWNMLDKPEVVKRIKEKGYDSVEVAENKDYSGKSMFIMDMDNIWLNTKNLNEEFSVHDDETETFDLPDGYIDRDGNLINIRHLTHNQFAEVNGFKNAIDYVKNTGNIRWSDLSRSMDVGQQVTNDQIEVIRKICKYSPTVKNGENIIIEVWDDSGPLGTFESSPTNEIWLANIIKLSRGKKELVHENFSLNDDDFEDTFDFPRGFIGRDGEPIEIGRQSHMSYAKSQGYDCDIEYCIGTGNVRWSEELNGMTVGQPLTSEQIGIIKMLAKYSRPVKNGDTILIDVWNKNHALVDSFETSPTNDIWLAKVIEATKSEKEAGKEKWRQSAE
jgi:hypothetical protein